MTGTLLFTDPVRTRRHHRPATTRRAFTLIELLVVITIIALLISILLPALTNSIKAAHRAAGLSNLRQIGIALTAFTVDHDSSYPTTVANSSSWDDKLGLGGYDGRSLSPSQVGMELLTKYIAKTNSSGIYRSPADNRVRYRSAANSTPQPNWLPRTYSINGLVKLNKSTYSPGARGISGDIAFSYAKQNEVAAKVYNVTTNAIAVWENPRRYNVLGRIDGSFEGAYNVKSAEGRDPRYWLYDHPGGSLNVLLTDGSARAMSWKETYASANSSTAFAMSTWNVRWAVTDMTGTRWDAIR